MSMNTHTSRPGSICFSHAQDRVLCPAHRTNTDTLRPPCLTGVRPDGLANSRTPTAKASPWRTRVPRHHSAQRPLSVAHPPRRAAGPGPRRGAPPTGDLPQPSPPPSLPAPVPSAPPASARPGPYPLSSSSSSRDWVRSEWQCRHHMVAAAGAGGPGAWGPGRAENRPLLPGAAGPRGPGRTTRGPDHPPRDRLRDHQCLLVPTAPGPKPGTQAAKPGTPPPPPRPPGATRGRAAGMWPGRGRGQGRGRRRERGDKAERGGAAERGGTSRAGAGGVTGAGAGLAGLSLPCSRKLGTFGAGAGCVLLQHKYPQSAGTTDTKAQTS